MLRGRLRNELLYGHFFPLWDAGSDTTHNTNGGT